MQKSVGFVRIKPIQCEKGSEAAAADDELFDPFVAVKVLDAETVPGQRADVFKFSASDKSS